MLHQLQGHTGKNHLEYHKSYSNNYSINETDLLSFIKSSSTEKLRYIDDQIPESDIFKVLLRPVAHFLLITVTYLYNDTQIDRTPIALGL